MTTSRAVSCRQARYPRWAHRRIGFLRWFLAVGCVAALFNLAGAAAGEEPNILKEDRNRSALLPLRRPIKGAKDKYQQKILFIGQLPYSTTKEQLERLLGRKGIVDTNIRMLTDKKTRKFRGIAFVEFKREQDTQAALRLDYSLFGGRRIRVEQTATGGRNSKDRKQRIKAAKVDHDSQRRLQVLSHLDNTFKSRDETELDANDAKILLQDSSLHESRRLHASRLADQFNRTRTLMRRADIDEEVVSFLCTLPEALSHKATQELAGIEVSNVENKAAYAMGVLKRKLRKGEKIVKRKGLIRKTQRVTIPNTAAGVSRVSHTA